MKVTQKQVEEYIQAADLELGPACVDDWVETVRQTLRAAFKEEEPEPEVALSTLSKGDFFTIGGDGLQETSLRKTLFNV